MNRDAVIRAAYFMCRALGLRTSRAQVNAVIAKQLGKGFRATEIVRVLTALRQREQFGNHRGTSAGTVTHAQNGDSGTVAGTTPEPVTLRELELELDSSLRSSSYVVPTKARRGSKNLKLPFDRALLDGRNAILRAVWERVQPFIARSTTWTDWRARNAKIATSLAQGGFTPAQVVKAWELASKEAHEPIRELSRIQRFYEAREVEIAVQKGQRSS